TVGKLYKRPINRCECGSLVLEVLICRQCGELYFNGFKKITSQVNQIHNERGFDTDKYTNLAFKNLNEQEIAELLQEFTPDSQKKKRWSTCEMNEDLLFKIRHRGAFNTVVF